VLVLTQEATLPPPEFESESGVGSLPKQKRQKTRMSAKGG
jgi:hypothetical protein